MNTLLEQLYMPSNDETLVVLGGSALTLMERISPGEQMSMDTMPVNAATNTGGKAYMTGSKKVDVEGVDEDQEQE